jgi:hypothetical protein
MNELDDQYSSRNQGQRAEQQPQPEERTLAGNLLGFEVHDVDGIGGTERDHMVSGAATLF